MQLRLAVGLLLVQLAAAAAGPAAATWAASSAALLGSSSMGSRQLSWISSGPSLTHGFGLKYKMAVYIDTAVAAPDVAPLANGLTDPATIQPLVSDFSTQLSGALDDKIYELYPPGMLSVPVSNVQPGYPVNLDLLMYVTLNHAGDVSYTKPDTVMEETDTWILYTLGTSTSLNIILASYFVTHYGIKNITTTANGSSDNQGSIQECRDFAAKHPTFTLNSRYYYIVGIIVPVVALLVLGFRLWLARRRRQLSMNRQVLDAAAGGSNGHQSSGPAIALGAVAAAPVGSSTYVYPMAYGAQQYSPGNAAVPVDYPGHKDGTGSSMVDVYADSPVSRSPMTQPSYGAYPSVVTASPEYGQPASYHPYNGSSSITQVPVSGYTAAGAAAAYPYSSNISSGYDGSTGNTATATAGGPIVRNQGVWSRMFGGPQVM